MSLLPWLTLQRQHGQLRTHDGTTPAQSEDSAVEKLKENNYTPRKVQTTNNQGPNWRTIMFSRGEKQQQVDVGSKAKLDPIGSR